MVLAAAEPEHTLRTLAKNQHQLYVKGVSISIEGNILF